MTTAGILAQQATFHPMVLSPPLLVNVNTFFAKHFVVFDQKIVQADLYTNDSTIFPPTVSYSASIRPSLFNAAGAIYQPALMYNQTLTQSIRFTNTNIFYAPRVSKGALFPGLLTNTQVFYAPRVVTAHIRPPLLVNTQVFYGPTVGNLSGWHLLPDDVFTNVNIFYAPTVSRLVGLHLYPDDVFTNENIFYPPTVNAVSPATTRMMAQPKTGTPVQVTKTSSQPEP